MTAAPDTDGVADLDTDGYRAVLRIPGAAPFCSAGALARLPQAMLGLGAVLMLTGLGRSFTVAGLVSGAISLAQGVFAPRVGRLVDRVGQRRVLRPQLAAYTVVVAGLVTAAELDAPGWFLVAIAAVMGALVPQIGAMTRARWTHLLGDDPRLGRGLAIESVVDEAAYTVGPVLVAFVASAVAPAAGLLTALGITLLGSLAFLSLRATEPPPRPVPDGPHLGGDGERRSGAMHVLAAAFGGIGLVFGFVEVGVVALADELGHEGAAGWVLSAWAGTSLVAGLVYGSHAWRVGSDARFLAGLGALCVGALAVSLVNDSLLAVTVALMIAGMANAPTLIAGNSLVPQLVRPEVLTEAYTRLGVMISAGVAVGAAAGGPLIDRYGADSALWACGAAGVLTLAVGALGRRAYAVSQGLPVGG